MTKVEHIYIDGVESKQCCLCHKVVPVSMFYKNKKRRDGLQTYCSVCALQWKREHKELINKLNRASKARHKDKVSAYNIQYSKNKYKTDDIYKLNVLVSLGMRHDLRNGKGKGRTPWRKIIGYTAEDLKKRLIKTLPQGYSWDDFLKGNLHIDHIIPRTVFNITSYDDIDFKKCWDLKNLQLLPAMDNCKKGKRLNKPFQPSLALSAREINTTAQPTMMV